MVITSGSYEYKSIRQTYILVYIVKKSGKLSIKTHISILKFHGTFRHRLVVKPASKICQ